jgi:cytochrome c-type protein NapC
MIDIVIVVALAIALLTATLAYFGVPTLLGQPWGRLALCVGAGVVPMFATAGGLGVGYRESSRTRFCLECHEMKPYGMSLFADNPAALPAVHYQSRLIDRDTTCYSCHADYALFGDVKTKLNGLRHVWAHYVGDIAEPIKLYQPYPNSNCLHCHDDARSYLESRGHPSVLAELRAGSTSCSSCHRIAHDFESVQAGRLWQAGPK